MGTYSIKTLDGMGTISFQTGNDEYFNVGISAVDSDMSSLGGLSSSIVETAFKSVSDIQDGSNTILSIMEAKNFNDSVLQLDSNNLQKEYNLLLKNSQIIEQVRIKSDIRNTSQLLKSNDLLSSITNELRLSSEVNNILQSDIFAQLELLNANIEAQTTAIKQQKLTIDGDLNSTVNIDTSALFSATQKLAEGVEDQKATNAKIVESLNNKKEHYEFLKNGFSDLTDSNGKVIKPRELEARKNAEQLIEQEDLNRTTIDQFLEFVPDLLSGALDEVGSSLGATDGFNINFNPLSYVDDILMTDFMENKDNYSRDKK